MKHHYTGRILACVAIFLTTVYSSFSQTNSEVWSEIRDLKSVTIGERSGRPTVYKAFRLDLTAMVSKLNKAVIYSLPGAYANGPVISIPMPDGSLSRFRVAYTPVMDPELAAQFPMIRTFTAVGIDDPSAFARLDYTQWGFHAMVISPEGWFIVDPAALGNTSEYIVFNRSHSVPSYPFVCGFDEPQKKMIPPPVNIDMYRSSGTQLRTYRLALACTGEYAAYYGGTVSGAMSGIVTSVNRVTQVYESELSIRLTLIANNSLLVYTNASTDPYTNSNGSTMLSQNQTTCTNVIGSANYDIGHVFSTGGGGVAYLGCVCNSSNKAGGVTGSSAPIGDNYDIDYVAHEMGHQFGGNHTFNSVTGSCNGNRASTAAYEPGSGTTIMAYAGICGADDIQPHSDAIFHTKSYDEIQIYATTGNGNSCPVITATGNNPPTVTLPGNYTIPKLTAFTLTGSGSDPNNDPLTFLWEQFDLGPSGTPNSPSGNAPLFRDFTPVTSTSRTFPRIQDLVRNQQTLGEILPSYARTMTFRFTARDNRLNGAGVMHDDNVVTITVVDPSDTFKVTVPNTNVSWTANSANTVTWKVASTNVAPVSCVNVNILLSIDSGYTFPYTLASNTPNDGSELITLPNVSGTKCRIKVESVGNVFFDFSNVNFTIVPSSSVLTTITTSALASSDLCAGAAVSVPFTTDGPANAGNIFKAQLSNSSGSFASPDSIGSLSGTSAGTINAVIPANKPAGTGYRIRVISTNPAVTGSNNGTNLTVHLPVGAAGNISGSSTVCAGQTGVVYTVPAITNATEYVWTVPANVNITSGSTTNSITVTFLNNATSGSFTVAGKNNGCGNGIVSAPFNVTVNPVPVPAGTISGNTSICPGQTGVAFSVPAISGATGYAWTLPTGATIATGNNTNSITVNFSQSAVSGNITVAGTNSCGAGTSSSLAVTLLTIQSAINVTANGPVSFCSGGSVVLSYTQSANSVYQWRKDGNAIAGQTGASYTATTTGIYDVIADTLKSYTNSSRISIPDNSCTGASRAINVSGYTGTVSSAGISVKINITHTYDADLVIFLQAPNGTILGLSNLRGGSGDNFTNTVFSDAGSAVLPTSSATAPFTGTYKPSGAFTGCITSTLATFAAIGGGSINPNGNWILQVYDRAASDTGSVLNWTLNLPASLNSPCLKTSNQISVAVSPASVADVSISSNAGSTICQGTNVTFTASPINGGASPSYQWQINGVNTGSNSPSFSSTSLSNGNVVRCIMTSNAGCVSNNPDTSNAITMTVNPNVAASVSVSANTGTTVCTGTNVTFTATPSNGGASPSYQWKIGGTNVGTNSPSYSNSSLANGSIVTCVMTSSAVCVTGSPATSNALTMTVIPNVNASVSVSANTGTIVCSGTNVTFTATPANGGASPSYQWKIGGTNVGTNSPSYANSTLSNGDVVTCVMTSNAVCVTGNPATSNALTMTVNPNVAASVSISANTGTTVCSGTNVTFTATPSNGGASPSYQWKIGGTNVGTNSPSYTNSTLANGDIVTCVMTSNAVCVTGNPATSNALTMTVNPNVTASVSVSTNTGTTVCSGTNVTFTAIQTNGGASPSYQWKIGSTNVGTNSPSYANSTLSNGDVVTCVMTSNASCVSGNPATSNALTMTVNPNVAASVSVSANTGTTVCSGTNVTFTATPTNGGASPSYQWKIGGTNVGSNSPSYSNSTLSNGDVVTCVMTSNAVCVTGSPATSNALTMTVNPSVTPAISIAPSPGSFICPGTNVTFTALPLNGGPNPVYQWKKNGGNVGTNSDVFSTSALSDGDLISCEMTSDAACVTGNPALSNIVVMSVNPSVTVGSFSPSGGNAGMAVTINGSGFLTASSVKFNNINASYSVINNNTILATVPSGNTTGPVTVDGCGQGISPVNFLHIENVTLQIKVMMEGLQTGGGQMRDVLSAGVSDSVEVSLANSAAPYAIVSSVKRPLNSTGQADFVFPPSVFSGSYYIVVDHRNCLQTWSSSPIVITDSIMQYDFTTAASKAYGNSLVNVAGVFVMYSGDSNKDGIIDLNDISDIAQQAGLFSTGYLPEDLDGDNLIDSPDYSLVENNLFKAIQKP